jgi:hypothetical protein
MKANGGMGVAMVLVAMTAAAVLAAPREWSLRGTLEMRGATMVDPPPEERRDTHAAFVLEGDAARALYDALPVKPVEDACLDDGSLSKQLGNLRCVRLAHAGGYECDFAIDLRTQTLAAGRAC